MTREKAWQHYFVTGDREPLIKAYWNSISYIAWQKFPTQREDMTQIGLMGLLKAIDKIDVDRVKSKDAWVFLNVRGMMLNARQFKSTEPLEEIEEWGVGKEDEVLIGNELDSLPKRESLILRLIHLDGYTRVEVGKMFGLSSMRIGQLEKRALQSIKGA